METKLKQYAGQNNTSCIKRNFVIYFFYKFTKKLTEKNSDYNYTLLILIEQLFDPGKQAY